MALDNNNYESWVSNLYSSKYPNRPLGDTALQSWVGKINENNWTQDQFTENATSALDKILARNRAAGTVGSNTPPAVNNNLATTQPENPFNKDLYLQNKLNTWTANNPDAPARTVDDFASSIKALYPNSENPYEQHFTDYGRAEGVLPYSTAGGVNTGGRPEPGVQDAHNWNPNVDPGFNLPVNMPGIDDYLGGSPAQPNDTDISALLKNLFAGTNQNKQSANQANQNADLVDIFQPDKYQSSWSGLPMERREEILAALIPQLLKSVENYEGNIDKSTDAAQELFQSQTRGGMKSGLKGILENLSSRNMLNSSVASDSISKGMADVAKAGSEKGYETAMNNAALKAQLPALLANITQLGGGSFSSDPLEPYKLLAQYDWNMM